MATKDERLEMRLSKTDRALIEDAAKRIDESVTDFTRNAALDRAQHVLARAEVTLMPAEQFDALFASLDIADEAPELAKAFAAPRRFKRG
ncbi:DUF1778 domain-containing protein [Amycolatopsis sp. NPDC051061]|uniref:type II toxin-antitoxin system TacA family antitoxin n=1 Tax=Amycolatopsis sp. NPDC051061 TaxID=3155042 RepID=UPI00343310D0